MTNGALTVVVTGADPDSASVRALAESWASAGLLTSSLWLTPDEVEAGPAGPPRVSAYRLSDRGAEKVDLFVEIGRFRLELVRLVVAHHVTLDRGIDPAVVDTGRLVSQALSAALPHERRIGSATGARLHRMVVVLPVSGTTGVDPAILEPQWEANIVVSPEDRADVDHSSVFVRSPGNFHGHAAAAIAAIGGVIEGVPDGAFDTATPDSSGRGSLVSVTRITIRAIEGDEAAVELAARVVNPDDFSPALPAEVLPWARPAADAEALIQAAARHVLDDGDWHPGTRPALSTLEERHVPLGTAVKTAARFNLQTAGAVLAWAASFGRTRAERAASEAIFGARSGTLVTLGARPVEELAEASQDLLTSERRRAMQLIEQAPRITAPTPSTWPRLRSLAFGLADGGSLDDFPVPSHAGLRELLPADVIVVPPNEQWRSPDGTCIRADDPQAMRDYASLLRGGNQEQDGDVDAATSRSVPESVTTPKQERAAGGPPAPVREKERAAYDAWFATQSRTLLWQIQDAIARRITGYADELSALQSGEQAEEPPAAALLTAQRRLRRVWLITLPVWVVLTSVIIGIGAMRDAHGSAFVAPHTTVLLALLTLVGAICVLGVGNHRFFRAVRRFERAVDERVDAVRGRAAQHAFLLREQGRLNLLAIALQDWVVVVGQLLHRPWSNVAHHYTPLSEEVIEALPAAMGVARRPKAHLRDRSATLLQSYGELYRSGWASEHFDQAYEAWESQQGAESRGGEREADLDATSSTLSARRRFRDYALADAPVAVSRQETERLLGAVAAGIIDLPQQLVRRVGPLDDGLDISETDWLQRTLSGTTLFSQDLFGAAALQQRLHYVYVADAWVPAGTDQPTDVTLHLVEGRVAIRVDRSRLIEPVMLRLFSAPEVAPAGESSNVPRDFDQLSVWA